MVRRPLRLDDVPAVTELLRDLERAEPVDEHFTEEDITELLSGPRVDLERGSVAVLDHDRLVGYGVLEVVSTGAPAAAADGPGNGSVASGAVDAAWSAYLDGSVRPGYLRRGIGTSIVRTAMAQATALRDRTSPGATGELKLVIPDGRPGMAALSRRLRFEPWRWFTSMRTDLAGHPALTSAPPPDPAGVVLRPYRPEDEEHVRLASNASFADHWGSAPMDATVWRSRFTDSSSFRAGVSMVATAAPDAAGGADGVTPGQVVGFVLMAEFAGDSVQRGIRTAYVSRVGTIGSHRGRGIASALLRRTLPALAAAGYARVELDVDSDSPTGAGRIYERLGFAAIRRHEVAGRRLEPTGPRPAGADRASAAAAGAADPTD